MRELKRYEKFRWLRTDTGSTGESDFPGRPLTEREALAQVNEWNRLSGTTGDIGRWLYWLEP